MINTFIGFEIQVYYAIFNALTYFGSLSLIGTINKNTRLRCKICYNKQFFSKNPNQKVAAQNLSAFKQSWLSSTGQGCRNVFWLVERWEIFGQLLFGCGFEFCTVEYKSNNTAL